MLTEERFQLILKEINQKKAVTVNELVKLLNASESTVRRDLNALSKMGKLVKVHGGATAIEKNSENKEDNVAVRYCLNVEEKIRIAKFAASLIEEGDFVYIDAGTTTEFLVDFINQTKAIYVTNGIAHAKRLIEKGCTTYILGGELKLITEAIIGSEAIDSLRKYNFTKGFFGANGIDLNHGYTTPDLKEALVKKEAFSRSKYAYILSDLSKFNKISSVTFGNINNATIITTLLNDDRYNDITEIVEVDG